MNRFFYCPQCEKEEIVDDNFYKQERTILNSRGGYGRPLTHYKCKCGNYLAGAVDAAGLEEDDMAYYRCLIRDYNKGGSLFVTNIDVDGEIIDMFEYAKRVYDAKHTK